MAQVLASRAWLTAGLALVSTAVAPAHADEPAGEPDAPGDSAAPPRNTVTANPVRYALLHFQLDYERAVSPGWSLFASPTVFHHATWYPFARAPEMTANGFGLDFGGRYFLTGTAPAGAFLGPFLSFYRAQVLRADRETLAGHVFSAGVQGGYTHLLGRWVLSAGGGLSYGVASDEAPVGSPKAAQLPHRGLWLNFRFNGGIAF